MFICNKSPLQCPTKTWYRRRLFVLPILDVSFNPFLMFHFTYFRCFYYLLILDVSFHLTLENRSYTFVMFPFYLGYSLCFVLPVLDVSFYLILCASFTSSWCFVLLILCDSFYLFLVFLFLPILDVSTYLFLKFLSLFLMSYHHLRLVWYLPYLYFVELPWFLLASAVLRFHFSKANIFSIATVNYYY